MLKQAQLEQFTGTGRYFKHWLGGYFTDGVKYMADEAGAYWLIDLVMSYQSELKDKPFQIWTLELTEDNKAAAYMQEDCDLPKIIKQDIPYTDFPLCRIKLYFIDGVLLLPSEY